MEMENILYILENLPPALYILTFVFENQIGYKPVSRFDSDVGSPRMKLVESYYRTMIFS